MLRHVVTSLSLALALAGAQACTPSSSACSFDTDCAASQACARGLCLDVCQSDDDCAPSVEAPATTPEPEPTATCQPYTNTLEGAELNVCAPEGYFKDGLTGVSCTEDSACVSELGLPSAVCSLSGTCIVPQPRSEVLVRAADGATEGPELLGVYLEDAQGRVVGWGVPTRVASATVEDPDFVGGELELTEDGLCTTSPVMPLDLGGEGGALRVYFQGATGARLSPRTDDRLVVIARSAACGNLDREDEYFVAFCVSPTGGPIEEATDCTTEVGSAVGSGRFDVTADLTNP